MELKEGLKSNEAQELAKKFEEDYKLSQLTEQLKDNKIEFIHQEKTYRVRLLTLSEKEELHFLRIKKYTQLLKDKDILLEKDFKQLLKERNIIDIDKLDEEIERLNVLWKDTNLKLGEALSKNYTDDILKSYESQIKQIKEQIDAIIIQKSSFLEDSLENQLLNYVSQYLTYLSLECKNNDVWVRAFDTLENFANCNDEQLVNKAVKYTLYLQYFGI